VGRRLVLRLDHRIASLGDNVVQERRGRLFADQDARLAEQLTVDVVSRVALADDRRQHVAGTAHLHHLGSPADHDITASLALVLLRPLPSRVAGVRSQADAIHILGTAVVLGGDPTEQLRTDEVVYQLFHFVSHDRRVGSIVRRPVIGAGLGVAVHVGELPSGGRSKQRLRIDHPSPRRQNIDANVVSALVSGGLSATQAQGAVRRVARSANRHEVRAAFARIVVSGTGRGRLCDVELDRHLVAVDRISRGAPRRTTAIVDKLFAARVEQPQYRRELVARDADLHLVADVHLELVDVDIPLRILRESDGIAQCHVVCPVHVGAGLAALASVDGVEEGVVRLGGRIIREERGVPVVAHNRVVDDPAKRLRGLRDRHHASGRKGGVVIVALQHLDVPGMVYVGGVEASKPRGAS